MTSSPLHLAALLSRSVRAKNSQVLHRAADRLLRRAATPAEEADALALWEACRESPDPVGTLLGLLRALLDDEPRGIGLDRAVKLAAARDGAVIREAEGRALLARVRGSEWNL